MTIVREPVLELLEKRPIVADGAMGTMLYSKGVAFSQCFDELNLSAPQLVKEIHLGYAKAGAELIETNTFGANSARLGKYGFAGQVKEINLAGARLAREIAGDDLYVGGSVGPLGLRLEPLGPTSLEEGKAIFREQIDGLMEGGVDLIILETMSDPAEAQQAILAAREAGDLPVIAQITLQEDGNTPAGTSAEEFTRRLDEWGADVIGLNCSVGPAGMIDALERMSKATGRKLSVQPNAGLPRTVDGRSIYLCSPEYMAEYAVRFLEHGARLLGGCCGTTPEHIRAIKKAVRSFRSGRRSTPLATPQLRETSVPPVAAERRSAFAGKLARGEFPVLVEMSPPKGSDAAREIEGAQFLLSRGVDALSIPDVASGTARMASQALAVLIQRRAGMEVLWHYACRGRDVSTIQSDLLGASALGLSNIVVSTGQQQGFQAASNVGEIDSIGVVHVINNLNCGLDAGGNPMGTQTAFLTGVQVNPAAVNMDEELRRFRYKVEAGADFALAQPVFEVEQLERFLAQVREKGIAAVPILAGIFVFTSYRNAEFLNNEVPGISVPQPVLERMREADAGEQARAEGLKIAKEMLAQMRGLAQGAHISAPFGRYALAAEVAGSEQTTEGAA